MDDYSGPVKRGVIVVVGIVFILGMIVGGIVYWLVGGK